MFTSAVVVIFICLIISFVIFLCNVYLVFVERFFTKELSAVFLHLHRITLIANFMFSLAGVMYMTSRTNSWTNVIRDIVLEVGVAVGYAGLLSVVFHTIKSTEVVVNLKTSDFFDKALKILFYIAYTLLWTGLIIAFILRLYYNSTVYEIYSLVPQFIFLFAILVVLFYSRYIFVESIDKESLYTRANLKVLASSSTTFSVFNSFLKYVCCGLFIGLFVVSYSSYLCLIEITSYWERNNGEVVGLAPIATNVLSIIATWYGWKIPGELKSSVFPSPSTSIIAKSSKPTIAVESTLFSSSNLRTDG